MMPANASEAPHRRPAAEGASGQSLFAWYALGFSDPLGDRLLLFDNTSSAPLELLRLHPELNAAPGLEFSLRERARELEDLDDPRYARVRRVDRLPEPGGGVAVVSEHVPGERLSDLLTLAANGGQLVDRDVVLAVTAELLDGLAVLHGCGSRVSHGAMAPERLVLASQGHVVITEYILGSALHRLRAADDRVWRQLRLIGRADPLPPDQQADVIQAGAVALGLTLGRALDPLDWPARVPALLDEAAGRARGTAWEPPWPAFRRWLETALSGASGQGFADAIEAARALNGLVTPAPAGEAERSVQAFLRHCGRMLGLAASGATPSLAGSSSGDSSAGALPPGNTASVPDPGMATASEQRPDRPLATGADTGDAAIEASTPDPLRSSDRSAGSGRAVSDHVEEQAIQAATPPADWELQCLHNLGAVDVASRLPPEPHPGADRRPRQPFPSARVVALAAACVLVVAGGVYGVVRLAGGRAPQPAPKAALVTIEAEPPGATLTVDGKPAGTVPVKLELAPGRHTIGLALGERSRSVVIEAPAGSVVTHHLELPEVPLFGRIEVRSVPDTAAVVVDGQRRGTTPLVVDRLAAGPHDVVLESRGATVRQQVTVAGGSTATLVVPLGGAEPAVSGWVRIESAVELQIVENGQILGTSRSDRTMMSAGRHDVELVNEALGFRTTRSLVVPAGRMATETIDLPKVPIDINAVPWAEVSIDGVPVGETPLGGVMAAIGPHVVLFRHPQLGERRLDCVVTLAHPVRLSQDLRK